MARAPVRDHPDQEKKPDAFLVVLVTIEGDEEFEGFADQDEALAYCKKLEGDGDIIAVAIYQLIGQT